MTLTANTGVNINLATIKISTSYQSSEDLLGIAAGFTLPTGVTSSWSAVTRTLTISGSATQAQYEAILEHVTYTDTSENPTTGSNKVQWVVRRRLGPSRLLQ